MGLLSKTDNHNFSDKGDRKSNNLLHPIEMDHKFLQVEKVGSSPMPSPEKQRDSFPSLVNRKFTPFKEITEIENPSDSDNNDILEGGSDEKDIKDTS